MVRVSARMLQTITEAAADAGQNCSEWVRATVAEALRVEGRLAHPANLDRPRLSPLIREAFAALQAERDGMRDRERAALERAEVLERSCDALERKFADEYQASADQIGELERRCDEWEDVRRACGYPDPVWLLAVRCLLASHSQAAVVERYGWLMAERGDWHLSWNRAHAPATLPSPDEFSTIGVDPREIVARREESPGAGIYVGLCMWSGPMWAGECQAGSEAAQDLEAELRTWLEDLTGKPVSP